MLRPHHRKNPQLRQGRRSPKSLFNPRIFIRGDAVLLEQRRGNRSWRGSLDGALGGSQHWGLNLRIGHGSLLNCRTRKPPLRRRNPYRRSSAARSHFAASAAATYALSTKSLTAASGEASFSTASYLKMN